jgi:hypothetical protein
VIGEERPVLSEANAPRDVTVQWGLKRSGNHLVANWLYANLGGTVKDPLDTGGLHPQFRDAFFDPTSRVAFYNNCGWLNSRRFALGDLEHRDFEQAAERHAATIFGIEDCDFRLAPQPPSGRDGTRVLILRDPLNNLASRLEGAKTRPDVFRTDEAFINLLAAYCAEFLGQTKWLGDAVRINFNRFVLDRVYRDELAQQMGLPNRDVVSEIPAYGGGSSFTGIQGPATPQLLMERFRQHRIPRPLIEMLFDHAVVRETCATEFGYDLAERVKEA